MFRVKWPERWFVFMERPLQNVLVPGRRPLGCLESSVDKQPTKGIAFLGIAILMKKLPS